MIVKKYISYNNIMVMNKDNNINNSLRHLINNLSIIEKKQNDEIEFDNSINLKSSFFINNCIIL